MSEKPESLFKHRVRKFLQGLDRCWFVKINQVSTRGTPDFLICLDRWFVALELKANLSEVEKAKKDRTLQIYTLDLISKAGGVGIMVSPETWETTSRMLLNMSRREL